MSIIRLVQIIATTPGVGDALKVVAASFRKDAAEQGVAMTRTERQAALVLLARDVIEHNPAVADEWPSWDAAESGLVLIMANMITTTRVVLVVPPSSGPLQ